VRRLTDITEKYGILYFLKSIGVLKWKEAVARDHRISRIIITKRPDYTFCRNSTNQYTSMRDIVSEIFELIDPSGEN